MAYVAGDTVGFGDGLAGVGKKERKRQKRLIRAALAAGRPIPPGMQPRLVKKLRGKRKVKVRRAKASRSLAIRKQRAAAPRTRAAARDRRVVPTPPRPGGYTRPPPAPTRPQLVRDDGPGPPPDRRIGWKLIGGRWVYQPTLYIGLEEQERALALEETPDGRPAPPRPRRPAREREVRLRTLPYRPPPPDIAPELAPYLGPEGPPYEFAPRAPAPALQEDGGAPAVPAWLIPAAIGAAAFLL